MRVGPGSAALRALSGIAVWGSGEGAGRCGTASRWVVSNLSTDPRFSRRIPDLSTDPRPERQRRAGAYSHGGLPRNPASARDLDAAATGVGPGSAALRALSGIAVLGGGEGRDGAEREAAGWFRISRRIPDLSTDPRPERQRRAGAYSHRNLPRSPEVTRDLDAVAMRVGPGSAALRALSGIAVWGSGGGGTVRSGKPLVGSGSLDGSSNLSTDPRSLNGSPAGASAESRGLLPWRLAAMPRIRA